MSQSTIEIGPCTVNEQTFMVDARRGCNGIVVLRTMPEVKQGEGSQVTPSDLTSCFEALWSSEDENDKKHMDLVVIFLYPELANVSRDRLVCEIQNYLAGAESDTSVCGYVLIYEKGMLWKNWMPSPATPLTHELIDLSQHEKTEPRLLRDRMYEMGN